uniref:Uncharacterized protein n=1 Tax=Rhipicephalus zambeziensis TaxID=60191 RepID=A0A224Y5M4_9ACAR
MLPFYRAPCKTVEVWFHFTGIISTPPYFKPPWLVVTATSHAKKMHFFFFLCMLPFYRAPRKMAEVRFHLSHNFHSHFFKTSLLMVTVTSHALVIPDNCRNHRSDNLFTSTAESFDNCRISNIKWNLNQSSLIR